jgi:AraC-like DNA-binding protein
MREVAIELGYKNPSHFSAAFKKHFGFLPTEMTGGITNYIEQ